MKPDANAPNRRMEWLLTLPSLTWLVLFFAVPTGLILLVMFRNSDAAGGVGEGWTLHHLRALLDAKLVALLWRTFWLSVVTTMLCLLLGFPVAWYIARAPSGWKTTLLLLVMLPFWTSFLLRVFAWKVLLHPEAVLAQLLRGSGIMGQDSSLLYHEGSVLLVMLHVHLPFAILPLYAAMERFDWSLLDAARDLGASRWRSLRRIFLPGIQRGLQSAMILVMVCALGSYIIPDMVGGTDTEMLGNRIVERTLSQRNLPGASALSFLLMAVALLPLAAIAFALRRRPS
jgi:spermidine/putrescine transport system permease protein